jgi:hypothetical protein
LTEAEKVDVRKEIAAAAGVSVGSLGCPSISHRAEYPFLKCVNATKEGYGKYESGVSRIDFKSGSILIPE